MEFEVMISRFEWKLEDNINYWTKVTLEFGEAYVHHGIFKGSRWKDQVEGSFLWWDGTRTLVVCTMNLYTCRNVTSFPWNSINQWKLTRENYFDFNNWQMLNSFISNSVTIKSLKRSSFCYCRKFKFNETSYVSRV